MTQLELKYTAPFKGLSELDMIDFGKARRKVYDYMLDGKWHKAEDIIQASGIREGLRRLRELREWFNVDMRKGNGVRNFEYQLREKT